MDNTFEEKLANEWKNFQKEQKELFFPNILIAGGTGTGKSSLINVVFGKSAATISDVKPETQGFHLYAGKNYARKVNLIDSAGYETDQAENYYDDLAKVIRDGVDGTPIHIIWYCISIANKRVEEFDIDVLEKLLKEEQVRGRMCIVFTKCDDDDVDSTIANNFRQIIKNELLIRKASIPRQLRFFETCHDVKMGLQLNALLEWSANSLDESDLRKCFIAAQQVNLQLKKEEAAKVVKTAAIVAAGIGATPIPFADAPILVTTQVAMADSILDIYDLSRYTNLPKALIGDMIMAQAGKAIVGRLLKWFPGIGTVVGALITGAVASSLTAALGFALSEICYQAVDNAINGKNVVWTNIFDSEIIAQMMEKMKDMKKDQRK